MPTSAQVESSRPSTNATQSAQRGHRAATGPHGANARLPQSPLCHSAESTGGPEYSPLLSHQCCRPEGVAHLVRPHVSIVGTRDPGPGRDAAARASELGDRVIWTGIVQSVRPIDGPVYSGLAAAPMRCARVYSHWQIKGTEELNQTPNVLPRLRYL